jgi:hypothetical protein
MHLQKTGQKLIAIEPRHLDVRDDALDVIKFMSDAFALEPSQCTQGVRKPLAAQSLCHQKVFQKIEHVYIVVNDHDHRFGSALARRIRAHGGVSGKGLTPMVSALWVHHSTC